MTTILVSCKLMSPSTCSSQKVKDCGEHKILVLSIRFGTKFLNVSVEHEFCGGIMTYSSSVLVERFRLRTLMNRSEHLFRELFLILRSQLD